MASAGRTVDELPRRRGLAPGEAALTAALEASAAAGLPAADVSPVQGALLELLARLCGARAILEIGTLAGYSTIWLARALPPDGRLVTLEADPHHAAVARDNLARAGLVRASSRSSRARRSRRCRGVAGPFDLVFIDADKERTADYLALALERSRPGTLIVADNVVRGGALVDAGQRRTRGCSACGGWSRRSRPSRG